MPDKKNDKNIEQQCRELHEHLVKKLGHNWRLETWADKYKARLRKYGFTACMRAVEGFCNPPGNWYVRTVSHRAPELIFRSDKAFEIFLVNAPPDENTTDDTDHQAAVAEYRSRLEKENARLTEQFHREIVSLKEELNEQSWDTWIRPLLFVEGRNKEIVLFHEQASWVMEHYGERLSDILGAPVTIIDGKEGKANE